MEILDQQTHHNDEIADDSELHSSIREAFTIFNSNQTPPHTLIHQQTVEASKCVHISTLFKYSYKSWELASANSA
jgi:hypothetical protein